MLFLHLREFVENDLLNMQTLTALNNIVEAYNVNASLTAERAATAAVPGVQLPANEKGVVQLSAALNGVKAHHLADITQGKE